MAFPEQRLRRLRRTPALRALARETRLHPGDLIDALFVVEGRAVREPISSMPGVLRLSVDQLADEAKRICDLGLGRRDPVRNPGAQGRAGLERLRPGRDHRARDPRP